MVDDIPTGPMHGGDISSASAQFGRPAEGWLDLSTGINPHPYPNTELSPATLARLPSSDALEGLLAAARVAYRLPAKAALCAAPGTQSILQILPQLVDKTDVAVLSPTYGEHTHLWRQAGFTVSEIGSLDQVAGAGVVVIVNPNNPDGRVVRPGKLDDLRAELAARHGLLIVDEAFADVTPEISLAARISQKGLLVLRSFGKFFGLAGIRLGFAAGDARLVNALAVQLGPWAVSGPAIEIGARALSDAAWIQKTREVLVPMRERLDAVLGDHGLKLLGGTDLYRLVHCDDADNRFEKLARHGVLVRTFSAQPDWLRFGLPGSDADFNRLEKAL